MGFIVHIMVPNRQYISIACASQKLILSRVMRKCVFAGCPPVDAFYLIDFHPYCCGKQTAHCPCIHYSQCHNVSVDICTLAHRMWRFYLCDIGNSTFVPPKSYRTSHQHAMFAIFFWFFLANDKLNVCLTNLPSLPSSPLRPFAPGMPSRPSLPLTPSAPALPV